MRVGENEYGIADKTHHGAAGYQPRTLLAKIREEKACVDYVVIVFHGGNETNPLPSPDTKERYRLICDMGADAVIACHTHCPQGYEMYGEKPIVYSMGNFVFFTTNRKLAANNPWFYGYLTMLNVEKDGLSVEAIPYRFDEKTPRVKVFEGVDKAEMLKYIEELSKIILDDEQLKQYFKGWAWGHKWCVVLPGDDVSTENYNVSFRFNCMKCEAHTSVARQALEILFEGSEDDAAIWAEKIEELQKMPI